MKIVTVIQARLNSSRLPRKVLLPLSGEPLLLRLYERVKASPLSQNIVIAIPDIPSENELYDYCILNNLNVFRGSENDLLARHYYAALQNDADAVVKIPSDCPLIDPSIITRVLDYFIQNSSNYDYVSNLHPAAYPDGNDVEIFSMSALKKAFDEADRYLEREHTTPYFWENPDKFRLGNVTWESGLNYSMTHRWTIDYLEDYLFIRSVYNELYEENNLFSMHDILSLLDNKPQLKKINSKYIGVNWYRNHLSELKTVKPEETKII